MRTAFIVPAYNEEKGLKLQYLNCTAEIVSDVSPTGRASENEIEMRKQQGEAFLVRRQSWDIYIRLGEMINICI